ncbi:hypothetical protein PSQ90_08660 [Devosia rhodophyticola]|uniref:Uncharacterized protein n=1 Tax=Devosia rhodophyticola TaxID=3026423 RepID=A0ABY7YTI5_9HYPH|nr:hypothetical protein [Devosia rhodophyticola]WDR04423.1 hypothetical protein PSQ90_08660 [Devosia rhodophyticola]
MSQTEYPAWVEKNPDASVVNTLANLAGAMIALWSIALLVFIYAAFHQLPAY